MADLFWSLWITSLVSGYYFLLAGILPKINRTELESRKAELGEPVFGSKCLSNSIFFFQAIEVVIQLIFFTIHFGLFHFLLSLFLNEFFPLINHPSHLISNFFYFIQISMSNYWLVVLISLIGSLYWFQKIFLQEDQTHYTRAYSNVIKIIFGFILFSIIGWIDSSRIGLAVLFVFYYFPVSIIWEFSKRLRLKPANPEK